MAAIKLQNNFEELQREILKTAGNDWETLKAVAGLLKALFHNLLVHKRGKRITL